MRIDCHVHLSAMQPANGLMSAKLLKSIPFTYLRKKFGMQADESMDAQLVALLREHIESAGNLDAVAVLAFDAVYDTNGNRDAASTHLYLANDYVRDLCAAEPRFLFGCSIHPYRRDAIQELERCVAGGAVLCKWLPITQGIDPSDPRCYAFYEALAHHGVPLLSHTGGETMLPNVNKCADPTLLLPALRRGVKVIAAHCGTRSKPWEADHTRTFVRMALEHEHFYGDTSALNWPFRWHAYKSILGNERVMAKLVQGSDWPIIPIPHPGRLGLQESFRYMEDANWLRRDVAIKQTLGFDNAFFDRAATVLRLPPA